MTDDANEVPIALDAARKDFIDERDRRKGAADAIEDAATESLNRVIEKQNPIPRNPNDDDPSGYFKGWKTIFIAGLEVHSLAKEILRRRRKLLRYGQENLAPHQLDRLKKSLDVDDVTEFRPALNAAGNCYEIMRRSRSAWESVSKVTAQLDPDTTSGIQVTLQVLELILENAATDMIKILNGEFFRWDVLIRNRSEEEFETAKRIVADAMAENPPRKLDLTSVRLSQISLPPAQRRIAKTISLARRLLARVEKYCAQQLYEHAARIMLQAKAVRTTTEETTVPQFSAELLADLREALRNCGRDAKVDVVKRCVKRRSQDVGKVLDYLKTVGEYMGGRGNGSRNGSDLK